LKKVLGLHAVTHDAGAALVSGSGICAIAEERLTRAKYDGGFPNRSLDYVLDAGAAGINDIDLIVFDIIDRNEQAVRAWLEKERGYRGRVHAIKHHDAHAAGAFFVSPFDEAAVLIVDACGSRADDLETGKLADSISALHPDLFEIQSFYRGAGDKLTLIRRTYTTPEHPIGIGILYALTSAILGFGELGAGKVMGLAAYGGKKTVCSFSVFENMFGDIIGHGLPDKDPLRPENFADYAKWLFRTRAREQGEEIKNRHAEMAAYVQQETQWVMIELARHIYEITRCRNLCLSGGVALNSITNKMIADEGSFAELFIQPAATDSGVALGCALYGLHVLLGEPRSFKMENVFFGRPYSKEEIEAALGEVDGIRWGRPENLPRRCAELLSQGRVLGWFRGGSELGPRALGHRSILADPRDPNMKAHLDRSVKHREPFRPYAPAVLEEKAADFFEIDRPSPFMLYVAKAKKDVAAHIPAVLHVDRTARLQTVNRQTDPVFYDLIAEFERLTDIPMLLNTSFNDAGEAIVETPSHALDLFLRTSLDYLVLEDILVEKL